MSNYDSSCLGSTVQAAAGSVNFFLAYLSPSVVFKHYRLPECCCWPCCWPYPLWPQCTHFLASTRMMIWALWQTGMSTYGNESTVLKWPPLSSDHSPIEHLWDVVEQEIHIMDVQLINLQQVHNTIMSLWTKISGDQKVLPVVEKLSISWN